MMGETMDGWHWGFGFGHWAIGVLLWAVIITAVFALITYLIKK